LGEVAGAWADLEDDVGVADGAFVDDVGEDVRVDEDVLAEGFVEDHVGFVYGFHQQFGMLVEGFNYKI
jgi:hypothetical protein